MSEDGPDESWGTDSADRWVRLGADIAVSGVWDRSGSGRALDELPIPPGLAARIERWAAWHDRLDAANLTFPHPCYWEQRADAPLDAFNAESRAIARALKAALPPDWTVVATRVDAWLRTDQDEE